MPKGFRLLLIVLMIAGISAVGVYLLGRKPVVPVVSTPPTTQPTRPKVALATNPTKGIKTYLDVIQANHPGFPTTQPLGFPLGYAEAAHLVLSEPVYVCPRGDLWITHPQADSIVDQQAKLNSEQIHVVRELVRYVHWMIDEGQWRAWVVSELPDGGYQIIGPRDRTTLQRLNYQWDHAISFNDNLAVPTDQAVAIHHFAPDRVEMQVLGESPRMMLDARGLIGWSETGSCARWVEGKWTDLGERVLQPMPLLDGSLLKIMRDANEQVSLVVEAIDTTKVDEVAVARLIEQLSDTDSKVRQQAFDELQKYGPGLWPILEKSLEDQSPEAQLRMRQLLGNRQQPSIGGMTLVDPKLQVVSRISSGGVVLFAPAGVYVPMPGGEPARIVAPVWLNLQPGPRIELLADALTRDLVIGKSCVVVLGEEWIVTDAVQGPRRFVGNALIPLVNKNETAFTDPIGIDRRGRWLFFDPGTHRTLVVDPTLPDPNPRLPAWVIVVRNGSTGWDAQGWPVMKSGGVWALKESGWQSLDKGAKFFTTLESAPPPLPDAPILTAKDGTRYFDGNDSLRTVGKDGLSHTWPLLPTATGRGNVTLLQTLDGTLFLFNEPGRVLRIKPTPDSTEPFVVEATFTRKIPAEPSPRRIWLDPAGRIVIAFSDNRLVILFPAGTVPTPIRQLMPEEDE